MGRAISVEWCLPCLRSNRAYCFAIAFIMRAFGGVGPCTLMVGGHLWLPPGKMQRQALPWESWGWGYLVDDAHSGENGFAFGDGYVISGQLLFWGLGILENFWGRVWQGRNMSIRTQISMKASVYSEDFLPQGIERSILTTSKIGKWGVCKCR